MTETYMKVARVEDVPDGQARVFDVGDLEIALCNVQGKFYAIENICSHDGGPLGEGHLVGEAIECPRHGARFDVKTGDVIRMPAVVGVRTFPTKVSEGFVFIGVEEGDL
jgi:3-phenylpropionate/trans-cinnamate dioxygenase ferredoxin subunit